MNPEQMTLFSEDDLLPISAMQDIIFCERRAALQQIECIWEDNIFTIEGAHLHDKVHEEETVESRGDVRIARGLRLRSLRLGLTGIADVIEFHREEVISGKCSGVSEMPENHSAFLPSEAKAKEGRIPYSAIVLPGVSGFWRPFIVEYKRGRLRHEKSFEVQLCAQALCLEEMLNVSVPSGAVFYGKPRRRLDVSFTPQLRAETEAAAARLHELFRNGRTPPAVYEKKCESCSLMHLCMPKTLSAQKDVGKYIRNSINKDILD
jgi:CRISPR-associated exonuclease Cas4